MTLTDQQWSAVQRLLRELLTDQPRKLHEVENLINEVETENGIRTYAVYVRWLDRSHPHPRSVDNPQAWPPELKALMTSKTPITSDDIRRYVAAKSAEPIAIHVTRDPTGRYGWRKLEDWP